MVVRPETPNLYGVKPVPYPEFELSTKWFSAFEQWFTANLGLKRAFIQLHNAMGYLVLRDLQSDAVLVGRERWLFLRQDAAWKAFRSEEPITRRESAGYRRSFSEARRWLRKRKIPFLFVVVPSKETVYPEYLPGSATRARDITRLDEVLRELTAAEVEYLDLRAPLMAGKRSGKLLYDRIDSHWNGRGASIGAELVLRRAAELMGRPPEWAALDSKLVRQPLEADLTLILSLEDRIQEQTIALLPRSPKARRVEPPPDVLSPTRWQWNRVVFETPDESLPAAIILRDSFGEALMPVMSEKFRRSVWLWTHKIDLGLVEREKPDIVIMELTERFLSQKPPPVVTRQRRR